MISSNVDDVTVGDKNSYLSPTVTHMEDICKIDELSIQHRPNKQTNYYKTIILLEKK